MNHPQTQNIGPGSLIKEELKTRGISQKVFAKAIGVGQSYLSDILSGRRRLSLPLAQQIESLLGISSRSLLDLQTASDIVKSATNPKQAIEIEASETINKINEFVCVKTLLKVLRAKTKSSIDNLELLHSIYGLNSSIEMEMPLITKGCFRKSSNTGLDQRMAATWVVIANAASRVNRPFGKFDKKILPSLCKEVVNILHRNENTLYQLEYILGSAGIGLLRVDKVDHASIDGFSFYSDGVPFIALTCRYDRIDNLAFTLLHELGHLFYGHTNPNASSINIDIRSFDEEVYDEKELKADIFAGDCLIDPNIWQFSPRVAFNPWTIQSAYTEWAHSRGLNEWIVLGRLSHETGMYKFKSNESRKINGGKEMCHAII